MQLQRGQADRALPYIRKALRLSPNSQQAGGLWAKAEAAASPGCDPDPPMPRLAAEYHSSGALKKLVQVRPNGRGHRYHGLSVELDAQGRLVETIEYFDHQAHGDWISWHPSGKKQAQTRFRHGAPHGTWVSWDEQGNKTAEAHYVNGKRAEPPGDR